MRHEITPGIIRVVGAGSPLLSGNDCRLEAQLGDGTWLMLRGVTAADIRIRSGPFVTARVEIELSALEVVGIVPDEIVWTDRRSRWQRFVAWVRRT